MSDLKEGLRINAIMKQDEKVKISIVAHPRTTIAKLKRQIEQEIHELHSLTVLVSVIEDSRGFALSNNSAIGEHLRSNETVYVETHREKLGSNMNLPSNVSDLFMTLRYVCASVLKKLDGLQVALDPLEVLPEIIHLGFWYSNAEAVAQLCRLLNRLFTPDTLDRYFRAAHDMQNVLLLKLLSFWFCEVRTSFSLYPDVADHLLALLLKLSANPSYAQLLKTHKIMKSLSEISKDALLGAEVKKMAVAINRNVSGKGLGVKTGSSYIPSALQQSDVSHSGLEEVLESLQSGSEEAKREALEELAGNPRLVGEACVRFDYYSKLGALFTLKSVKDKGSARTFSAVLREMTSNTSKEKAKEVMQKDVLRKTHAFLLDSHPDCHEAVLEYMRQVGRDCCGGGVFNIEQANELLASPYLQFQRAMVEFLAEMSEKDKQISPIRFLPSIKDYIRLCLKTESDLLTAALLRILANLTLDEQCRYQVINLKGIETFVKFLQIADKHGLAELQRTCAKGLLNLSLSSRETKAKILSLLGGVLERFYKGSMDAVAGSYIESLLKSTRN